MEIRVDHYEVLGLPSGEEGTELTQAEISKAFRAKALNLHPDKRPDDPNADANFQCLKSSYEILKDQNARKLFDASLIIRAKREEQSQQSRRHNVAAERGRMLAEDIRDREKNRCHCDQAKQSKTFCDLEARARERRWDIKGRKAGRRGLIVNGTNRVELFGDLDEVLKRLQYQRYGHWQCDMKLERCCSIPKQENQERLIRRVDRSYHHHLRLPMILLFFFVLRYTGMLDMYCV